MKSSLKITLVSALALLMPAACAAVPASAAESLFAAYALTDTAPIAAPDTTVSERDASGAYNVSGAVVLPPDGGLTISSAGTYLLSGH